MNTDTATDTIVCTVKGLPELVKNWTYEFQAYLATNSTNPCSKNQLGPFFEKNVALMHHADGCTTLTAYIATLPFTAPSISTHMKGLVLGSYGTREAAPLARSEVNVARAEDTPIIRQVYDNRSVHTLMATAFEALTDTTSGTDLSEYVSWGDMSPFVYSVTDPILLAVTSVQERYPRLQTILKRLADIEPVGWGVVSRSYCKLIDALLKAHKYTLVLGSGVVKAIGTVCGLTEVFEKYGGLDSSGARVKIGIHPCNLFDRTSNLKHVPGVASTTHTVEQRVQANQDRWMWFYGGALEGIATVSLNQNSTHFSDLYHATGAEQDAVAMARCQWTTAQANKQRAARDLDTLQKVSTTHKGSCTQHSTAS